MTMQWITLSAVGRQIERYGDGTKLLGSIRIEASATTTEWAVGCWLKRTEPEEDAWVAVARVEGAVHCELIDSGMARSAADTASYDLLYLAKMMLRELDATQKAQKMEAPPPNGRPAMLPAQV